MHQQPYQMIRNSTHKYRQKYEKSLPKNVHSTTFLNCHSTATLPNIESARKTMSYIQQISSTKKLQTIKNNKESKVTQYIPSEKFSDYKLKKKAIVPSSKEQKNIINQSNNQFQGYSTADKLIINPNQSQFQPIERDPEKFIEQLPKNTVFFCCKCFQYIFQIEKKRHFPDCKDMLNVFDRKTEQFKKMANQRIQNIVELSRYTRVKTTQVQQLYKFYEEGQSQQILKIRYNQGIDFYKLEEIVQAFCFTFQHLLRGTTFYQKSGLFNCF